MIYSKLKAWKEESDLTYKDIGERSGTPAATVQKIISGETQNPNADTVYKIVKALGHTMEELYEGSPKEEKGDSLAVSVIREMYEHRIADLKEQHKDALDRSSAQYEKHIEDLKESKQKHGKTYKAIIAVLGVIVGVLFVLFIIYFAMDYANEHWGIFFRE